MRSIRPPELVSRRVRAGGIRVRAFLVVLICVAAVDTALLARSRADAAQVAETVRQVKRVYVGSFGSKPGASELRERVIRCLRKTQAVEIVPSPSDADAMITGTGEIWIKEYIRTNPQPSPWTRQPVYDGYLSVQIKGKDDRTLSSYRVTHGKFVWDDITEELAKRFAKKFQADLKESRGTKD